MSYGRVFFYYWQAIKKHRWSFFLVFLAYGVGNVFAYTFNPYIYKKIIDLISLSGPSTIISEEAFGLVWWVVVSIIIYTICYRVGDYAIVYSQTNILREISNDTFRRLMGHSYKFFSDNFAGSLVAKAKRFSSAFMNMQDTVSFSIWHAIVQFTGTFVVLMWQAPLVGSLFLGWVFVYFLIASFFIKRKVKYDLQEAAADSKVTGKLADSVTNILNSKIFSGSGLEQKIFEQATTEEKKAREKAWGFMNLQNFFQSTMMAALEVLLLYVTINLWLDGKITTGLLVLVQFYMVDVFHRLWDVNKSFIRFFKALSDAKEMSDILDQVPDILDPENPEKVRTGVGLIEFNNVNFEYIEDHAVFKNFNLAIRPGEKVGLVGHSGSGKSTIVKMLLRFADVKNGEILIDGQNVARLRQDDLRSKISYVPQEAILFHRPIRENIAYSRPEATETEVIQAAKSAHADEFIRNLPQGYDTLVGERGVKLSGGERQRVAIARAMLKNAPILVLDEATSSLDSVSESYIQDAFNELMKGKTTIVIAHRLSTIQKMDRIIVLDKGEIVEEGSHKELLARGGIYKELWDHQTGGFLE